MTRLTEFYPPMGAEKPAGFNWRKFWRKAAIRLSYRAMELLILLAIGLSLGFKLIRY